MNQPVSLASSSTSFTPAAPGLPVAWIAAQWHTDIVERGHEGFAAEWARLHGAAAPAPAIERFAVPGAFEMPLLAQRLARSGRYAAVVACALVVDGGIYRHEFVAAAVVDGLMRVQLDTGVPVFSVSLTPKDFHEHATHRDFFSRHFVDKGAEAARACQQTLAVHAAV
ncbi:6,7-dimethyl-8-ribityllumazine synthase [Ottowia sp. GY511]|uniref:6,7-dimethyl-8-ribityllumazine synthase n=1 Tax=Ottowia flava TaxID=2675430 RepID=A0ABW4KTY0_9BURK|nr:6,7-dimethyl-8-ribityllumazine synthase [Ottowia sp. GY511]TXK26998.1 6,7-dimethyl-8-ribityllumazine synthase [Ottowia sp. GY511]